MKIKNAIIILLVLAVIEVIVMGFFYFVRNDMANVKIPPVVNTEIVESLEKAMTPQEKSIELLKILNGGNDATSTVLSDEQIAQNKAKSEQLLKILEQKNVSDGVVDLKNQSMVNQTPMQTQTQDTAIIKANKAKADKLLEILNSKK